MTVRVWFKSRVPYDRRRPMLAVAGFACRGPTFQEYGDSPEMA